MKTTLKMSAVQNGKFKQMKKKIVQRKQYYQDLFVMLGAAAMLYTNLMEVLMQISNQLFTDGSEF